MLLHRYFATHADVTLRQKRLLISRPSQFNDPFEFVFRYEGKLSEKAMAKKLRDPAFKEQVRNRMAEIDGYRMTDRQYKMWATAKVRDYRNSVLKIEGLDRVDIAGCHKMADDYWRICCFSRTDVTPGGEILLWSHYAGQHTGVRVEFDLPDNLVEEQALVDVDYAEERVPFLVKGVVDPKQERLNVELLCRRKAKAWEYEREVRLMVPAAGMPPPKVGDNGRDFIGFDATHVKSIAFGIRCPTSTRDAVAKALKAGYTDVPLFQAAHHQRDYAIEYLPLRVAPA